MLKPTQVGIENLLVKLDPLMKKSKAAKEACTELKYFVRHLKTFGILEKVSPGS
jgi:hypothetical protein